jgi:hypothetical protein
MKTVFPSAVLILLVAFGLVLSHSQSSLSISPGSTLSACPAPAAKALIHCNVAGDGSNPDGDYVSANGAAYFLVSKVGAGGVTSVFGRTGAVAAAANDYSYAQLSSPPTTVTCSTFTISNTGGLVATGCILK